MNVLELIEILKYNSVLFKHRVSSTVKFAEVDSFGVVHNIQYLYWLEWARTEYLKSLGIALNKDTFKKTLPVMVVHTEIDYFDSASLGEEYEVLTRISFIKNSSFGFENIIRKDETRILAFAKSILAHIEPGTGEAVRLPEFFRQLAVNFEKGDIIFSDL